ncbi:MAG TPA: M1 family aminopeptidase [Candidatus Rubrimentiphilum sp.]|nr:M1 family aminopeptidase [Candidatus Rubrimentiphilum sp.]
MKNAGRAAVAAILGIVFIAAIAAPPPRVHPRPYGRGQAYYHKTAIAPYRFHNTLIKMSFDFAKGIAYGDVTNVISPKANGLSVVPFNSVGLQFSSVTVNGAPAHYNVANDHLYVNLAQPAKATDTLAIEMKYSVKPVRGIYFIRPDKYYPNYQPEIWSQGESEDNRLWLPTWDEPNQKTPVEQIITVQKGWRVTANGHLKSYTANGSTSTWDWVEPAPLSTYLIAFSAGPYVRFHTVNGTTPVDFFTSQADAQWGSICFGRTNQMVAFFQKIIGVPYPWEKYDQTAVERFTAGGMENASATTQTELAIHPPQYDLERSCDGLVSHELAHQWWGDDVTMADWPNVWINEGYATYFQELWSQHHFGEAQFQYERYHAQQAYFGETRRYWRPIVEYRYANAMDSFDSSGYPRPGQVLHMLRWMYGDAKFFHALHDYLLAYQHKNANTHQFFVAIGKSLGTNLDWFENEWFYRPAYPDFWVKESYDATAQTLTLDVTQKNHDGKPFTMPIDVGVWIAGSTSNALPGGAANVAHFTANANHQVVTIPNVASQPVMVLFDYNNNVLRGLHVDKSIADLGYQALHAPYVGDRLWAVANLGRAKGKDKAAAAGFIRQVVTGDPFYGVRVDALDTESSLDDAETVRLALHDKDPRVVIAAGGVVENLDHPSVPALQNDLKALTTSSNPLIAGAALRGLGATKMAGAYEILVAGLNRHAFREPVAIGALTGLANLGDFRAIPLIKARAAYGVNEAERLEAISSLGTIGKKNPTLVEGTLIALARSDPYFRARSSAIRALGRLNQKSAIPALQFVQTHDTEPGVRNAAWDVIADLKDRGQ